MLKFTETEVVFSEIPDEITLAINVSNCQNNCVGCHSPYLKQNIGEELTTDVLDKLIEKNNGITCVCFMGEGKDELALQNLMSYLRQTHPNLKIGLYSGRDEVLEDFYWQTLDYLKIGAYVETLGPLNSPTTNQRLWKHDRTIKNANFSWINITSKFWKGSV